MNSLLFSLPNITDDINITDFIVLEAIKVFDYSAYQKIYNDFLVIQRKAVWQSSSFDNGTIIEYPNVTTKSLLEYLFVKKGSITELIRKPLNSKNLRDPEYFKRYYTLYISSKDVSQETLTRFLTIGRNREQIFRDTLQNGKIKNLLNRLSDKDLSKHYTIDDIHILDSFLRFWDQNGIEITEELYEYLWLCYFNLAYLLTDKYEGAKVAINNLVLRENELQPMRFVFNYFIILFKETNRLDNELKENIIDQIELILSQLKEAFEKHIVKQWHSYVWSAEKGEWPLVGRLFVYAMAKYVPSEYKNALDKHMVSNRFISFLIRSYFIMSDKNKAPEFVDLSKKDLLLPGGYWDKFINILNDSKKGTWSQYDQKCVDFLLSNLS
jgi:hypothetical protein